jgi:hypothetical protein
MGRPPTAAGDGSTTEVPRKYQGRREVGGNEINVAAAFSPGRTVPGQSHLAVKTARGEDCLCMIVSGLWADVPYEEIQESLSLVLSCLFPLRPALCAEAALPTRAGERGVKCQSQARRLPT